MKKRFDLENVNKDKLSEQRICGNVEIVGEAPESETYVIITVKGETAWVKDEDLELLAVNILKALNSKRVLQGKIPYYKRNKFKPK